MLNPQFPAHSKKIINNQRKLFVYKFILYWRTEYQLKTANSQKLTLGEVAAARSGSNPPHAITNESLSCESIWTVFMTKTLFSLLLTASRIEEFSLKINILENYKRNDFRKMQRLNIKIEYAFHSSTTPSMAPRRSFNNLKCTLDHRNSGVRYMALGWSSKLTFFRSSSSGFPS